LSFLRRGFIPGLAALWLAVPVFGQDLRYHLWQEETELDILLRACSQHLDVPIEFDRSKIKGRISIEAPDGLTFEGLWALTNRRLADEGMACIQCPGQDTLTVVPLDDAPGLARIEHGDLEDVKAGFVRVLYRIEHADPRLLEASLKILLPNDGTAIGSLAGQDYVMVSGPRPQVSDAISVLGLLDAGPKSVTIDEIEPVHISAQALESQLERVARAREEAGAGKLLGTPIASAATGTLLLVAPSDEQPLWREWVERFDRQDAVLTKSYAPRRFGLAETAELIEEVVGTKSKGWRLVLDDLTGSLLITAPFGVHEEIAALLERLESTDVGLGRDLRSYPVAYRDVEELLDLLGELMERGSIPHPQGGAVAGDPVKPTGPRSVAPADGLTLTADKATNRILAYGEVHLLGQLEELIGVLDVEHPQVLVEVLMVSLTESQIADLGVELRYGGESGGTFGELASLFGLGAPGITESSIPTSGGSGASGVVLDPGTFVGLVRALEAVSGGRTLTTPKLLVANHADAEFNSLLQTPYLATTATNTVATTSLGGTSDAGTSVTVTPHILDGDRLRLEYSVSISSFVGAAIDPALPPPRQENLLTSTVVVPDGHSVVIGGVEVETEGSTSSRVPLFGRIPILGALFRSDSEDSSRSHFFVFLRCNVLGRGFEELRYLSGGVRAEAGVAGDFPVLEPRVMR